MESRIPFTREELYNVQMDVKQLQLAQNNHAERLQRLEKRQANDAAVRSVWDSPFPSALGGTPQHGPVQLPPNEMFDDFEEQGQTLLGSLHLDAEDEPARRGAASRANSVRFDESALQSSSWAQNGRHSGDFGPIRPGSGMGSMMERSLSHKSDGRHSSAGHSVHSVHSHHSIASGRGSSLGLDTNFATNGTEDDSPTSVPAPPPVFFVLGTVPSIVRCWLTSNFAHDTLLYADICTGSQKSLIEFSLIKDLDLVGEIRREMDGTHRIRLPIYLTEATVAHPSSRGASPAPQIPSLLTNFEVSGMDQPEAPDVKRTIRIFVGSETLREYSADILFSQNRMTLYSSEREKLWVPFVRPEDDITFRYIRTMSVLPEKPKLNANARPFVFGEPKLKTPATTSDAEPDQTNPQATTNSDQPESVHPELQPTIDDEQQPSDGSDSGGESMKQQAEATASEVGSSKDHGDEAAESSSETQRRESTAGGIWTSWRQGPSGNGTDHKENAPLSGYQPAGRGRNMKVLKSSKSSSSTSARTGASYEPPPPPRTSGEQRRKSQPLSESTSSGSLKWKASERPTTTNPSGNAAKPSGQPPGGASGTRSVSGVLRTSANPVGGASAFSWMNPVGKTKTPTTPAE